MSDRDWKLQVIASELRVANQIAYLAYLSNAGLCSEPELEDQVRTHLGIGLREEVKGL